MIANFGINNSGIFDEHLNIKKRQQNYNLQLQLKSQIQHNISVTSHSLQIHRNMKHLLTKKDAQILQNGLVLPQTNNKYSLYLPQSLENQFITRFTNNQYSYEYDHFLRNQAILQFHHNQIVKTADLNEESFQDRYLDSVRIVTNFTLKNQIPNQKVVLLLLDFHQHPLTVVHFIQFLTRLNYKVVCPYLPDIFLKSVALTPNESYGHIISIMQEICKLLIQGEFQIVAHGMSAPIGLRLRQQFGLLCQKVVLCNPLLNFEKPPRTDSFVESDTKQQDQIPSQSESSLSMDDLEYSIEKTQRSHLQATSPSEQSTIEPVNTQQQYEIVQSRPSKLQRSTKTQVQTLETPSNSIKQTVDNTQYLKDGQINELNQELQVFYKDVQLLSGLMKAHDVSRLSDLELVTDVNRFFKINSLLTPVSFMFRSFLRLLYGVFVFSPLEQLEQYHIYKSVFDRHFFESFAEMKIMLETNKTQWTDDMNLYCLVSSHGCFNSEEHLKKMNESRVHFKKTQCRTIVGAGHDLFSVAGNVIEKLLR
ncbi:Conserved_hypothetical protein [Hexamita inflata]|uniref:Uncharacterized protein n=1 Tax=Hexamita inflata TaxID=28002 RepID=A0AA86V5A5_9EUKA|nr:Conserved hypothetical protein [Hexamita inflata]